MSKNGTSILEFFLFYVYIKYRYINLRIGTNKVELATKNFAIGTIEILVGYQ